MWLIGSLSALFCSNCFCFVIFSICLWQYSVFCTSCIIFHSLCGEVCRIKKVKIMTGNSSFLKCMILKGWSYFGTNHSEISSKRHHCLLIFFNFLLVFENIQLYIALGLWLVLCHNLQFFNMSLFWKYMKFFNLFF